MCRFFSTCTVCFIFLLGILADISAMVLIVSFLPSRVMRYINSGVMGGINSGVVRTDCFLLLLFFFLPSRVVRLLPEFRCIYYVSKAIFASKSVSPVIPRFFSHLVLSSSRTVKFGPTLISLHLSFLSISHFSPSLISL